MKSVTRGDGRSATGAAAYRAGERLRDERTGVLHNHARRLDVSHKEILLPSRLSGVEPDWARDRASLWNAAERAEGRRNARVAREYEISLPAELSGAQRLQLARVFARELSDRHNTVIDLAVHEPRPTGDPRNYHAHLLETTREITATGFGAKAGLDMAYRTRQQHGLPSGLIEFNAIRERWAMNVNDALEAAGLPERVDHRSYAALGIDREPMPHIPYAAVQTERRGLKSEIAERLRAHYRLRVQQRLERRHLESVSEQRLDPAPGQPYSPQTLEQLRQRGREQWLRMRQEKLSASSSLEQREPSLDEKDLSL